MRQYPWRSLFAFDGRVHRLLYFLTGTALVAVKYAIDFSVAAQFGEKWRIWNYFVPSRDASILGIGTRRPELYAALWTIAIPFFWIGIALTLRRLRDAGRSAIWTFLFFIPPANLALFLWLSLAPSIPADRVEDSAIGRSRGKVRSGSAAMGIGLSVALGIALVILSAHVLMLYSWGLFLGVPFLIGFVSSWFMNVEALGSTFDTIKVNALTIFLVGLALLGLRYEGLVCLLMAIPLALPFSIAGGLVARSILHYRNRSSTPTTFAAWIAVLPLAIFIEHAAKLEPPMVAVTTSITIEAPVATVWKNVIAFPPLAPPQEWTFRAGIAYPTSAEILGSGPGAVRYCRFSTGNFVEPITMWDENRLLAFDVASQPQAMRELSPWKIAPPHLERNYMRSRRGQFRLVALDDHHTLLEGTTWYQDYFWPQIYWQQWSDEIVHQIHIRVLRHIKQEAEEAENLSNEHTRPMPPAIPPP